MSETSQELSDAQRFIERRVPHPSNHASGHWVPCSRSEVERVKRRGHDDPTVSALFELYEVYLCPDGETWPDGDTCWTWVLEYAGQMDMPSPIFETSSGHFVGDEAGAKGHVETIARMLSGMVET